MLFTASLFASLGSMIQPAQWMRFYAARSAEVLRRSALIFAAVLTLCFFFGVMLVGLGGQVLYPLTDASGTYLIDAAGKVLPHPSVGRTAGEFDQILVVVLKNHLPELLGSFGAILAALILVAIMAAAMSTADSNLHAFSTQLLPLTVDMLYLQRGTRQGAIAGLCIGLTIILLLSPFFPMLASNAIQVVLGSMKTMIDTGAWGLLFNVLTFTVVSHFTRK